MEKIKPGKYVELIYDVFEVTAEGDKLVHQIPADDAEKIVFGVTPGVIEPLEQALEGLEVGGEFDVVVGPEQGYGPFDPEKLVTLPKDIFVVDDKFDADVVKPGAYLPMMTADGFRVQGLVTEVTDKDVKMDFNHPLAGKDVRFKGKVTLVREATPEELQPAHGCGCGCGDQQCGEGCNCDEQHHCGDDACGCR